MAEIFRKYVLGIDGGGTKTVVAIADLTGKIILQKTGGPANWYGIGKEKAEKNLKSLFAPILKKYNAGQNKIIGAVFGLAGLDTKTDFLIYQKIAKKILLPKIKFQLFNDTKIALEALPEEQARLLIISGTGSNVYGEYNGKNAKAGGWGFILADEGSAYEFGLKAIKAAIKSFDGREQKSLLEKLVLERTDKKNIYDLITEIYRVWERNPKEFKNYVASFASLVDKAYYTNDGDRAAKKIIIDGAEELFISAKAVIEKLEMRAQKICVGFTGSNFKAPLLKDLLSDKIKKMAPEAYFADKVNPAEGAIKLAINL